MNGLRPASFYLPGILDSISNMFKNGIHMRILIMTIVMILAGQHVSASEESYGGVSKLRLVDQFTNSPDFAQPMISDNANGLRSQTGSFKTAFARRAYKSKIYRSIGQRFTAKSEFSSRQEFPAKSISGFNSYLLFNRPYYYTFLFRLTPF